MISQHSDISLSVSVSNTSVSDSSQLIRQNHDPLLMEFNLETSYAKVFHIPHSDDIILTQAPVQTPPLSFRKQVIAQIQQLTGFWSHLKDEKDFEQVLFLFFHSAMSNTVYKVSLHESIPSIKKEPVSFILRIYGTGMDTSYSSLRKSHQDHENKTNQEGGSISRNASNNSIHSTSSSDLDMSAPVSPFAVGVPKVEEVVPSLGHSLEALWMSLLSEENVSPCVYGQFGNGRIEETILDGSPLSAPTIRLANISEGIAVQLSKLHASTDSLRKLAVKLYRECHTPYKQLNAVMNHDLHYWKVIQNSFQKIKTRLPSYSAFQYDRLMSLIPFLERDLGRVLNHNHVFCHSDLQYGNIMASDLRPESENPTIILIDYEYGAFGPRGFDIANHFFEWMCNYHTDKPHEIHPTAYPDEDQKRKFFSSYLRTAVLTDETLRTAAMTNKLDSFLTQHWSEILLELQFFTLISDVKWAFWGIEQYMMRTKETPPLPGATEDPHQFYLDYSFMRINHFWSLQESVLAADELKSFPISNMLILR